MDDEISRSTDRLIDLMDAGAGAANAKMLLHPTKARAVVHSRAGVANAVGDFQGRLGIERGRQPLEPRRWADAATEVRDKALKAGVDGVGAAMRLGDETLDQAKSATGKLSGRVADPVLRRRKDHGQRDEKD
jgi:hypothetical protein